MTDAEAKALFQAFAEPLFRHATTAVRQQTAERLARTLWLALVTGPDSENLLWESLKDKMNMNEEGVELIRQVYVLEMKPQVGEEQLASLRQRYQVRRKD